MSRRNPSPDRRPSPVRTAPPEAGGADDETPGLPGFRRWREVYLFVFVVFVGVVVALAVFSSVYA